MNELIRLISLSVIIKLNSSITIPSTALNLKMGIVNY